MSRQNVQALPEHYPLASLNPSSSEWDLVSIVLDGCQIYVYLSSRSSARLEWRWEKHTGSAQQCGHAASCAFVSAMREASLHLVRTLSGASAPRYCLFIESIRPRNGEKGTPKLWHWRYPPPILGHGQENSGFQPNNIGSHRAVKHASVSRS